jgi:hypothetical protein
MTHVTLPFITGLNIDVAADRLPGRNASFEKGVDHVTTLYW